MRVDRYSLITCITSGDSLSPLLSNRMNTWNPRRLYKKHKSFREITDGVILIVQANCTYWLTQIATEMFCNRNVFQPMCKVYNKYPYKLLFSKAIKDTCEMFEEQVCLEVELTSDRLTEMRFTDEYIK